MWAGTINCESTCGVLVCGFLDLFKTSWEVFGEIHNFHGMNTFLILFCMSHSSHTSVGEGASIVISLGTLNWLQGNAD